MLFQHPFYTSGNAVTINLLTRFQTRDTMIQVNWQAINRGIIFIGIYL